MTELLLRLSRHDQRVLVALVSRRRQWLDRAMRAITHLGGSTVTVTTAVLLLLSGHPAMTSAGARGAFALVVSHLLVQALKRTVARPRPHLGVGLDSLVAAPDRFSFPSGHAAASLSMALAGIALLPTALAGALLALALVVGASRCYLGVHYPGDVLAGWLLAALATAGAGYGLGLLAITL